MPSARSRIRSRTSDGKPRDEPRQELLHRLLRERLEVERGEAALPGAPGRPPLQQLGPSERDDEDRVVARPVEEVLDEVEQARVGPLHVLEQRAPSDSRRRAARRRARHAREQVLLVARLVLGEPEEVREARLEELPLLGVEDVLLERRVQLAQRGRSAPRPRRCGSACAPCRRAPSTSRPRRRRDSGRGASTRCPRSRRSTCRTPTPSRDLPIPAMPVTETRCALRSSAQAWNRSFICRSSRSRPTNGASSPCDLSEPAQTRRRRAAPAREGSALPSP